MQLSFAVTFLSWRGYVIRFRNINLWSGIKCMSFDLEVIVWTLQYWKNFRFVAGCIGLYNYAQYIEL